jgi:hypothetical protein
MVMGLMRGNIDVLHRGSDGLVTVQENKGSGKAESGYKADSDGVTANRPRRMFVCQVRAYLYMLTRIIPVIDDDFSLNDVGYLVFKNWTDLQSRSAEIEFDEETDKQIEQAVGWVEKDILGTLVQLLMQMYLI